MSSNSYGSNQDPRDREAGDADDEVPLLGNSGGEQARSSGSDQPPSSGSQVPATSSNQPSGTLNFQFQNQFDENETNLISKIQ